MIKRNPSVQTRACIVHALVQSPCADSYGVQLDSGWTESVLLPGTLPSKNGLNRLQLHPAFSTRRTDDPTFAVFIPLRSEFRHSAISMLHSGRPKAGCM